MPDWSAIASQLALAGIRIDEESAPRAVSGGDISAAWRVSTNSGDIFVKTGSQGSTQQFAAEGDGLREIAASGTIRVPEQLATGSFDGGAFLAMEWLELEPADKKTDTRLGEQLAAMHSCTDDYYGWHRDNWIGLTPQHNPRGESWVAFFRDHRLGFQLHLAAGNGYDRELQSRGEKLLDRLPQFFDDSVTDASLLHGDLWGGNWGVCSGEPVVFDPAVFYGDRESDIAMTKLFGGFGRGFYEAYETHWPRRDGYRERECLYQLYHILNHLNLFGRSYLGRAVTMIDKLH